jgi:hypothetical protein
MSTCNRRPAFRFYLRGAHRQIGLGSARAPRAGEGALAFANFYKMGLTGLEPVTLRLSSACSNQLSYRPKNLATKSFSDLKIGVNNHSPRVR